MRVSNCINCNKYKYLEKDGKCRDCLNEGKIHVGTHNNKKIFINKSNIYENINIIGMIGAGKTTLQKHLVKQILNKNHGLCYMDIYSDINENDFTNIQRIKLSQNKQSQKTINLLDTVRQRGNVNYIDEIKTITESIMSVILEYSKQNVNIKSIYLLKNIIKLVIDSNSMNLFDDIHKCLINKSKRCSAINNKSDKITINTDIKNITMKKHDTLAHTIECFSDILDNKIISDNSNINIKNVILNSEKLIFDFSHINNNRALISSFIIKKLFTEIRLQDKSKFVFCVNRLDGNSLYSSLENEYKCSNENNTCFISTANMPSKISSKLLNIPNIQISFKLHNGYESNKMSKKVNISQNQIDSLSIYNFIINTPNKTVYPLKLDL